MIGKASEETRDESRKHVALTRLGTSLVDRILPRPLSSSTTYRACQASLRSTLSTIHYFTYPPTSTFQIIIIIIIIIIPIIIIFIIIIIGLLLCHPKSTEYTHLCSSLSLSLYLLPWYYYIVTQQAPALTFAFQTLQRPHFLLLH